MKSTLIQVHVEPSLKQKADELFYRIGIDMTTAIRLFFTQSLLRGTLPFEIITNNDNTASPRQGWAEVFSKAKQKEQILIPDTIDNNNFDWKW